MMNFCRSKIMASFPATADFVVFLLTACLVVLVNAEEPKLDIYPPNQNPILAPAKVSFGLMCVGKAEDGEFTDMKWFNPEGEEIRGNVRRTDNRLKLTFPNPNVEDSGIYKCTTLFSNTITLEEEVRVEFYEPIKFEECPEIQNLVVGLEGRIKCRAVANPRPTISWEKDDNPIKSDRLSIDELGISISSVSEEDEGTYSLEAVVKETGNNRVQQIEVNVLIRPNIIQMENLTREEGRKVVFECLGKGAPMPRMSFRKGNSDEDIMTDLEDGIELEAFSKGEFNGVRLQINNVKRSAAGLYFCKASNAAGVAERVVHLQVQFHPDMSRTVINSVKACNHPANLTCIAEANPNATITWKFQGDPIELGDERFKVFGGHSYSSLLVWTADDFDVFGTYTCEARNALGESSVAIDLVKACAKPTFYGTFENITVEEGQELTLNCSAEGDGNISYEWYKYEEKISEDANSSIFVVNYGSDRSALVIREVSASDEGVYVCEAKNELGLSSKMYELIVFPSHGADNDTSIAVETGNITSNSVQFFIDVAGSARQIEVKYTEKRDTFVNSKKWNYGDDYKVEGLHPGGLYTFQFRTVPSKNNAWSKEYQVILLPDAPDVLLENLDKGTVKLRWFRTVDDIMRETVEGYELKYFSMQIQSGSYWIPGRCPITIQIPVCSGPSYTVSNLNKNTYYEIQLRARTSAGYGEPYKQKISIPQY